MLKIDFSDFYNLELNKYEKEILEIHDKMEALKNDQKKFLGLIDYVADYKDEINKAKSIGEKLRKYEKLVIVGIGGSFLGAKSFYDILGEGNSCQLIFVGNNISGRYLKDLLRDLEESDFAVNVISKSGGTLEPAIAFRLVKDLLYKKYGKEAGARLVVTTDPVGGNLKKLALKENYETLAIPGNVGGRYSVFTPVGLLPLAAAGINVDELVEGVKLAKAEFDYRSIDNLAYRYALARQIAEKHGKSIEIYTAYEPRLNYYMEWLKQLYGESEGKEGLGIYPMSVINTRDLHSLGQFIQEGRQSHFETILWFEDENKVTFKWHDDNFDGLNFLAGTSVDLINRKAMEGTRKAHKNGNIPNILMEVENISPKSIGYLSYFFMKACGMSCYLLGVKPFNQPGVEEYKKEVKKLLKDLN